MSACKGEHDYSHFKLFFSFNRGNSKGKSAVNLSICACFDINCVYLDNFYRLEGMSRGNHGNETQLQVITFLELIIILICS